MGIKRQMLIIQHKRLITYLHALKDILVNGSQLLYVEAYITVHYSVL